MSRDLLDRCRRGEPEAFEELVERTHRGVFTLAYRLVGDRHEAEDVAQDAYLRMYRGLPGFRGDSSVETWLYRITANAAVTHLRRRGRFGDLLEDPDVVVDVPDAPVADPVDRDEIQRALGALPVAQRTVLVMKDAYGFSIQEIADELGLTEGAVKVRIHRARRRLKELVYGTGEPRGTGHEDVLDRLPELAEERGHG
ncbi:MAG: RNA polymerase sigma factor [Actinomycetota bacterium]